MVGFNITDLQYVSIGMVLDVIAIRSGRYADKIDASEASMFDILGV